MKNFLLTALWLIILLGAETAWPGWLKLGGLRPDLVLVFVVLAAVRTEPPAALGWALAAALGQLSLGSSFPASGWEIGGPVLICGLTALIISGWLRRPLFAEPFYRAVLVLVAVLLAGAAKAWIASTGDPAGDLVLVLTVAVYSAVLAPLLDIFWPRSTL